MPVTQNQTLAQNVNSGQTPSVTRPVSVRENRWWFWSGTGFAIVMLACFAHSLLSLIRYTATSDLHSYILLVPFVSVYLLYIRRHQLPKDYASNVPLGILFSLAGIAGLVFTNSLDSAGHSLSGNSQMVLSTICFLSCLAGGVAFFLGNSWIRAAAFPLGFLVFMVPMPDAMVTALETASKYASAEVANILFHLSGIPFLRAGLIFQLPNITIEVAQACSGIRSSWVLFITSVFAANLFLKSPWRRIALVTLIIPLAILRNGFRIMVIGLLCVNMGPQMIESSIHRRGGPLFFMLSLIPLFAVLLWLRRNDVSIRRRDKTDLHTSSSCP